MKNFKIKLFLFSLFCFSISAKSQNLETIKVYYDYARTQIKEVYTVKKGSGMKEGIYKFYDENRMLMMEAQYSNNMKNGITKTYYDVGKSSITSKPSFFYGKLEYLMTYKNDELDGNYRSYTHETGKQVLKFDTFWSNGELIKSTEYYKNGNKKETKQKNGVCNVWYETGEKMVEYTNVNFIVVGLQTEWFKNGKIIIQGTWNNEGKEQGVWKQWDEDGVLTETLYENGVDVEKERIKGEIKQKNDFERSERLREEQEFKRQEIEKEIAKQKLENENQQKNSLFNNKIKNTKEKSEQVEKMYVVVDEIQTSIFGKEVYKIKKKNIYNAFKILQKDLSERIKNSSNVDDKIVFVESLENLLNLVVELREKETKDIEKELKNVVDSETIKIIFKI